MWSGAAGCEWDIWEARDSTESVVNHLKSKQYASAKLATHLTEWMWPYLSCPCSVLAKAKLEKFTSRVYDFHQGFLNISVGGRKANFSPTFCNDSYSLQYF